MADLIDRAAPLEWLNNLEVENDNRIRRRLLPKGLKVADAIYMVNKLPAVDAVEVIHCIDCKYACLVTDHDLQCLYDDDSLLHPHSHYCSYGERRTGNGNL